MVLRQMVEDLQRRNMKLGAALSKREPRSEAGGGHDVSPTNPGATRERVPNRMNATECAPSARCIKEVRSFFDGRQRYGFWVEYNRALKYVTMLLPTIFTRSLLYGSSGSNTTVVGQRPVMVDFGAGMYGKENSPDDSDALAMLAGFKSKIDVHAFEARPDKAEGLMTEALRRNSTAAHAAKRLHVHAMGAADVAGQLRFANCGGATNWMLVNPGSEPPKGCHVKYEVPVSSLDEMARAGVLKGRRLVYVKVDVEGSEMSVAKGMRALLSRQEVDLLSFEYAKNWNIPMFIDAQRGNHRRINASMLEAFYTDPAQTERTLESFQSMMSSLGYDTYLLHGGPATQPQASLTHTDGPHNTAWRTTLVPVYAPFFDRTVFEICLRRHHFKQQWCWNDLLVVRRSNLALKRRLFAQLHARQLSRPFPSCNEECL